MAQTIELKAVIDAEDRMSSVVSGIEKKVAGFKGKLNDMEPAFKKMAAVGTVAFGAITAVVGSSIAAYAEVERANRQLENAVIAVSKGTMAQVKAIDAASQALEKKSGIDGDALKIGLAQLSTFGLQSESVVNLTKSLADFTVNQNGVNAASDQYVASANTIAKALNGQFGILEKSGIRFTKLQQTIIKTGTESEKVAALQEGLAQNLRETTDTVGGVDVAMAKWQRTTESVQDQIAVAMIPVLTILSDKLLPVLQRFSEWAEKNPELLTKIILISGAVTALIAVLGIIGLALPGIITAFAMLGTVVAGVGTAMTFLATTPMGLVLSALALTAVAVWKLVDAYKAMKKQADEANEAADRGREIQARVDVAVQKAKTPEDKARLERVQAGNREAVRLDESVANANIFKQLLIGAGLASYDVGGIVPGSKGAPQLAVVHGGEKILTADEVNNGQQQNIIFNFNGAVAGDDGIKKIISAAINKINRQSTLNYAAGK